MLKTKRTKSQPVSHECRVRISQQSTKTVISGQTAREPHSFTILANNRQLLAFA